MQLFRDALLLATLTLCVSSAVGELSDNEAAQAATKNVERFFEAWNAADNEALRQELNYPFISLFGGGLQVDAEAAEFSTDFDRMRELEGWHHSSLDSIEMHSVSAKKVNCTVGYSRRHADGTVYRSGRVRYIVTEREGHWGIQFRSGLADDASVEAESEARRVLDTFFEAWNAADNDAIREVVNFPHAFILGDGRVAVAQGRQDLRTDFERMRRESGWHDSTLDSAEVIQKSATQVELRIVFSRRHADGTAYLTVPANWFVTKQGEHWGVQVRSMMPRLEIGGD